MIGGAREGSTVDEAELSAKARRLAAVIEPFAGQVYFSPECHGEYAGSMTASGDSSTEACSMTARSRSEVGKSARPSS
jgi:hypothetical protein